MTRCNPTMYPGADGCPALATALFAAGIPGASNIDCMKSCQGCTSERAVPRLRLVPPCDATESSSPQRLR
jgi:hypothetical protein